MSYISLSSDFAAYDAGDYILLNNVWGKSGLRNGVDFSQSIGFSTENPTENITFSWSWPYNPSGTIVSYPEIIWGDSPFSDAPDEVHDYVTQVADLDTFIVDVAVRPANGSSYVNVAFDLWLTNVPEGGESSITAEIMIWLDWTVKPWGTTVVGTYSNGEQKATIYFADGGKGPDYIAVLFDKPWLDADVDIKSILDDLVDKGLISEDDYIGGHQFGAEVSGGRGSLVIDHISTEFATKEDSAEPIVTTPKNPVAAVPGDVAGETHEVRSYDAVRPDQLVSISLFDASWKLIKVTSFAPGTDTVSKVEVYADSKLQSRSSYDAKGNLTEILKEQSDGTHEVQRFDAAEPDHPSSVTLYSASWKLISVTSFSDDGARSSINVFGDNGLNTISSFTPGTDKLSKVEVYVDWQLQSRTSYDSKGNVTEILKEHADGTHEIQRFDVAGLKYPTSVSLYDSSWALISSGPASTHDALATAISSKSGLTTDGFSFSDFASASLDLDDDLLSTDQHASFGDTTVSDIAYQQIHDEAQASNAGIHYDLL